MFDEEFSFDRYAEIVNVKLGNGQVRKGQVLEIAGKKAVVQVSPRYLYERACFDCARSLLFWETKK